MDFKDLSDNQLMRMADKLTSMRVGAYSYQAIADRLDAVKTEMSSRGIENESTTANTLAEQDNSPQPASFQCPKFRHNGHWLMCGGVRDTYCRGCPDRPVGAYSAECGNMIPREVNESRFDWIPSFLAASGGGHFHHTKASPRSLAHRNEPSPRRMAMPIQGSTYLS